MKRSMVVPVFVVCMSSMARAQIASPTYANLYWERANQYWDSDIAAAAGGNSTVAQMTQDMIDSYLRSALSSDWVQGLVQYGVTVTDPKPMSFRVAPEEVDGSSGALTYDLCRSATLPNGDDLLSDWEAAIPTFIACAVALHPELQPTNVVLNIFVPPYVAGGPSAGNDPCADGKWYGPALSGPSEFSLDAVNFESYGHTVAFLPTEPQCRENIGQLIYVLSHEDAEGTTQQREIADVCEGLPGEANQSLPFLGVSLADYEQFTSGVTVRWEPISDGGTEPLCMKQSAGVDAGIPCVCVPPTPPPATLAPTGWACGAGRKMVVQETVDPMRNSLPWDLPSASNGFEGSLYFALSTDFREALSDRPL